MVFVSGMLGIDPSSGHLVAGGVEAEARQALRNLAAVLQAAGSSVAKVGSRPSHGTFRVPAQREHAWGGIVLRLGR